jgi:ABC-2 type transport system ATP-binding protein
VSAAPIELSGVTKRFGAKLAVQDLDLRVPEGSLCGFIGPNGSGKTTTIRMILRILLPSRGTVRVLGAETGKAADDRTGYLPEERGLYRRMRVRELLRFLARLKGVRRPEAPIDRWLERLELRDRADSRLETLSKGLAQKVQFIAAVVHDPRLLILDEPFSGLDPVNVETLREIVLDLRRRGTTVVLSTHDMEMAERLCDTVVMVHEGRKVLDGPVDEIKAARGGDIVRVRFAGDPPDLAALPGVARVVDHGREHSLELDSGADPRALAAEVLRRGALERFEVGRPSLREIFVSIARPPES